MKIAIIIVNYKTAELLMQCLESLRRLIDSGNIQIVISDNNSPDNSIAVIEEYIFDKGLQKHITLLSLPKNGGFSYGNNEAIKYTLLNYSGINTFWLLNPDTIVNNAPIELITQRFRSNPEIGIIGTKQTSLATGAQVCSAFNMLTPFSEFLLGARNGPFFRLFTKKTPSYLPPTNFHQCDWVSGASFFISRTLVEDIGLMDENFFLYFEEVDYCLRAKKNQWQIWSEPEISIAHKDDSSTGVGRTKNRRPAFWYNSRRYFYLKHYGLFGLIRADFGWFIGRLSLLTRHFLGLKADISSDPQFFMFDLLISDLKAIISSVWKKIRE